MADTTRERVFACWVPGIIDGTFPEGVGLYRATTAGKARAKCLRAAHDASFDVKITQVRSRRAPQYDSVAFKDGIMPKYVEITPRVIAPEGDQT